MAKHCQWNMLFLHCDGNVSLPCQVRYCGCWLPSGTRLQFANFFSWQFIVDLPWFAQLEMVIFQFIALDLPIEWWFSIVYLPIKNSDCLLKYGDVPSFCVCLPGIRKQSPCSAKRARNAYSQLAFWKRLAHWVNNWNFDISLDCPHMHMYSVYIFICHTSIYIILYWIIYI